MTWTRSKTAGLVVGILILVILITTASILIYRRVSPPKRLADSEADVPPEPHLVLPGPIHETGTVRRQTGLPQTFHDWVHSSNNEASSVEQGQYTSLGQSPGPLISSAASSMYSRTATPRTANMARPWTRDSMGTSSLHRAVLEAADPNKANEVRTEELEKKEEEALVEDGNVEATGEKEKPKGYSGAWP